MVLYRYLWARIWQRAFRRDVICLEKCYLLMVAINTYIAFYELSIIIRIYLFQNLCAKDIMKLNY